jgi:mono/diheme cytochrome c family protein
VRVAAALVLLSLVPAPALAAAAKPPSGEILLRAAGCVTCHSDTDNKGAMLAGGRALRTDFGTLYTPNITPDARTGIGNWRLEDFRRALREGVSPGGEHYYPAFPYTSYTRLSDKDIELMWNYLRTVKPVFAEDRPHELKWYVRMRRLIAAWKWVFFSQGTFTPDVKYSISWNRGAYLVEAVAHCGECHTPRNLAGALKRDRRFAGTGQGPDGAIVPNITPDRRTGIGRWSRRDVADYLASGAKPDGDYAGDIMAEFIDSGLTYLSASDRNAIAEYVQSLSPVENAVGKSNKSRKQKGDFEF